MQGWVFVLVYQFGYVIVYEVGMNVVGCYFVVVQQVLQKFDIGVYVFDVELVQCLVIVLYCGGVIVLIMYD